MPRRKDSNKELRTYTFNCDQRRAMKRRVAGVFAAENGIIHLGYGDGWRQKLVRVLGKSVQPVLGKRRDSAHFALVERVVDDLFASREVTFTGAGAKMSPKCIEKQQGISRMLRERAKRDAEVRRAMPRKERRQHRVAAA